MIQESRTPGAPACECPRHDSYLPGHHAPDCPYRSGSAALHLSITLDSAAFDDDPTPEIARLLVALAGRIENDGVSLDDSDRRAIRDLNGNTIGHWWVAS